LSLLLLLATCASNGERRAPPTQQPSTGGGASSVPKDEPPSDGAPSDADRTFSAGVRLLANDVVERLDPDRSHTIASFEFTRTNGTAIPYGGIVLKSLVSELVSAGARTGRCEVVDRQRLDDVVEELALGQSDLMDATKAVDVGKQVGASLLLRGTAEPWGEGKLRIWVTLIEVETTKIPVSCYGTMGWPPGVAIAKEPEAKEEVDDFVMLKNPDSSFDVQIWTERAVYRFGESITVHVCSSEPGYLYLFDIDASGSQTQLLPNVHHLKPVRLEAGKTFISPSGWFVTGPPEGHGYLKAIVTPRPNEKVDTDFSGGDAFKVLGTGGARGIAVNTMKMDGGFGACNVTIKR
jgi:hypothetical protein